MVLLRMRHLLNVIVLVLFCGCAAAQTQFPTYTLKVYNNGYKGRLAISGYVNFFFLHGDTTLTIQADIIGQYYLNTGTSIGGPKSVQTSYIYLYFNQAGLLDSISPTQSATISADRKSITLNTVSITVNPGRFTREWYPSFGVDMDVRPGFYYGKKTVQLIKGQTYAIDNAHFGLIDSCGCDTTKKPCQPRYNRYYSSYFYFTIMENGQVKLYDSNLTSARACGRKLRFKTVIVTIDPAEISGGDTLYIRKPYAQSIPIAKKTKLPFIRGIVNYVYWPATAGKETKFPFLPM